MPNKSTPAVRAAAANRSAPEPHISSITRSFQAGRQQAASGTDFDPPIWIRQSVLYSRAFLQGYQSVVPPRIVAMPRITSHPAIREDRQ